MRKIILSSVACATLMFAANSEYKYEITPMVGGVFTEGNLGLERNYADAGLALGFNQTDSVIDQVEVGFLSTMKKNVEYKKAVDVRITRVFANIVKEYPLNTNFSLYALAGLGVELFQDENKLNRDGAFFNYGLGAKYKVAEKLAVKFDLRHAIESGDADNNLLYTLGLSVPFGKIAKPAPVEVVEEVVVVEKDSDNDGVIDANDQCPNTVAGVAVDKNGCELDDDKDGVVNRLDECPSTMEGAEVDSVGCISLVDLKINFATNSAKINHSYDSRISKFAEVLKSNPKLNATIKAYTDSTGSKKYNKKLSEKRAMSAVKALKALNVDASRLKAIGYGEENPVATNKTKEGRAANRRVTATINK